MSTAATAPVSKEITIVGHTTLFYYWPVWAVGFLFSILTFFEGNVSIVVPPSFAFYTKPKVIHGDPATPESERPTVSNQDAIVLPGEFHPWKTKDDIPKLHVSKTSSYGVIFSIVLLLVITITNVPLRGMWSFAVIGGIVIFVLLMSLFSLWDTIFHYVSLLDIRLNMGAYFFISSCLLAIWILTVFFFDKQIYMVFTPGQLKVCLEIGGGETSYDTVGLVIQKERSDLFRHWVLGLGSGDLIVRTSGSTTHEFHLNNVLFITQKLQKIEDMQRERPMVKG